MGVEIAFGVAAIAVAASGLVWWRTGRSRLPKSPPPENEAASAPIPSPVQSGSSQAGSAATGSTSRSGGHLSANPDDDGSWLGQTVGGYHLETQIGQGGMATVYRARSKTNPDGWVALKLIRRNLANDPTFRRRFDREVRVCQDLVHPNIVRLEDWGEEEGVLFLALEYVDGDVLTRQIVAGGLPDKQAIAYVVSLIEGLDYAHQRGIVHRDLKPDNILLTSSGQIKIADFGLARTQDGEKITKTGDSMGTPAYFPPEQITGAQPTAAADQYSLGIILYELLTGVRPFNEPNPLKMLFQHLSEAPPSPLVHRSDLHPTLADISLRMLAKKPEDRFLLLQTVKEGLQSVAEGREWQMPAAAAPPETSPVKPAPQIVAAAASGGGEDSTLGFQFLDEES